MIFAAAPNLLVSILASPATLTIVTLITAVTAGYLYRKQRRDRQKDAAGIILREIKDAENMLPAVKRVIKEARSMGLPDKIQVMKSDSWAELQHVLARRLPEDVLKTINEFYANCHLLDEALTVMDDSFYRNADEARVNQYRIVADLLRERVRRTKPNPSGNLKVATKNEEQEQIYQQRAEDFKSHWPAPSATYIPVRAANDAEKYLEALPSNLSQTRVGDKLRRVSMSFWERLADRKES